MSQSKIVFEHCLLHRKAAEAAPHSKTQAKIKGENHGHVLECGSVLPLCGRA